MISTNDFFLQRNIEFVNMTIYVNNVNFTRTLEKFNKTVNYLKIELEMKDFEKIKLS